MRRKRKEKEKEENGKQKKKEENRKQKKRKKLEKYRRREWAKRVKEKIWKVEITAVCRCDFSSLFKMVALESKFLLQNFYFPLKSCPICHAKY